MSKIRSTDFPAFDYNVSKLLTFFIKIKKAIAFVTGDIIHKEYARLFFSALKNSPSDSFNLLVITKNRDWESVLAKSLETIREFIVRNYNSLAATGQWRPTTSTKTLEAKVVVIQVTIEQLSNNQKNRG